MNLENLSREDLEQLVDSLATQLDELRTVVLPKLVELDGYRMAHLNQFAENNDNGGNKKG